MVWLSRNTKFWMGLIAAFCLVMHIAHGQQPSERSVLIVIGAAGEAEYGKVFRETAQRWKTLCETNGSVVTTIDGTRDTEDSNESSDRERVKDWIRSEHPAERWIVLIGHGTSDKDSTKFNLRGPDLSSVELAKAMDAQQARWLIVHGGSSSGPFLQALSGPNRVVIVGTKSGAELNFARFGEYLSQTISEPDSDLDHDQSVSILEAFLAASSRVAKFYADENRLASEQALLDDNGDKKGTPAAFYRGARPVKAPAEGLKLDGNLAANWIVKSFSQEQILTPEQKQELELLQAKIELLRERKSDKSEEVYYAELEELFARVLQVRRLE